MSALPGFDLKETPLNSGIQLIEASAGTGKTYTISHLIQRILLEGIAGHSVSIEEILVVTFTNAATDELKDRIRRVLYEGLNDYQESDVGKAKKLSYALANFDEASVFTIDGFCQRTLKENAFETQVLLNRELQTDPVPLWREIANDYFRKNFYELSPWISALLIYEKINPRYLESLLRVQQAYLDVEIHAGETISLEALEKLFGECVQLWKNEAGDIIESFPEVGLMRKNSRLGKYREPFLDTLSELSDSSGNVQGILNVLRELRASQFEKALLKDHKAKVPVHRFYNLCEDIHEASGRLKASIALDFLSYAKAELGLRKEKDNYFHFSDLQQSLHSQLNVEEGTHLADKLGQRYKVALIDEFQDTNAIQYGIFKQVFSGENHALYLIGDPKQAIYGFRGGDIFSYLQAKRDVGEACFSLKSNWRSQSNLIRGINSFFEKAHCPFVFEEEGISFDPVIAAGEADKTPVCCGGEELASLVLRYIDNPEKKLNSSEARNRVSRDVVFKIVELLSSDYQLGHRDVEAGDIAILTRSRQEAETLKELLLEAQVPAIIHSDKTIFEVSEAKDFFYLLSALLDFKQLGLMKLNLFGKFFSWSLADIDAMDEDDAQLQNWMKQFQQMRSLWFAEGFMSFFRDLSVRFDLGAKILSQNNGERVFSNIQQLAEVLHKAEGEFGFSPIELLNWLGTHIEEPKAGDEYLLRLEKEDRAVQILTIHKSKGLEYPIVFCPFNWGSLRSSAEVLYHRRADQKMVWEWDAQDEHRAAQQEEDLAESVRLLYVALTRARNLCYLYWGDFDKQESSSIGYMFGLNKDLKGISSYSGSAKERVQQLVECSSGGVLLESVASGGAEILERYERGRRVEAEQGFSSRSFSRLLEKLPMATSFSGLTSELSGATHSFDKEESSIEGVNIFNLEKGAKVGNFYHEILEELDFQDLSSLEAIVRGKVYSYGIDADYVPCICENIEALMKKSLDYGPSKFSLDEISLSSRLIELEFYYPLQKNSGKELSQLFASSSWYSEELGLDPEGRFMKGFIDLVFEREGRFYILDWKSNWLGSKEDDYSQSHVKQAMIEHHYVLQYHIYVLALHLYLKKRLVDYSYDKHFGGVYYLFLRGVGSGGLNNGIFYDCPELSFIESLEGILIE